MEQSIHNAETASHLALRVALQTMKERCIMLQKRLNIVEDENQQMRENATNITPAVTNSTSATGAAEMFQLRLQVAELQRQKTQLNEHINMVSNENRKLWSRLSQMAKEQSKLIRDDMDCTLTHEDSSSSQTVIGCQRGTGDIAVAGSVGGANQNLIRSKTFTQHSPNPHLRHKMISSDAGSSNGNGGDISLEDVTLPAYADAARQSVVEYAKSAEVELGFGYLNVVEEQSGDGGNETDFSAEAKKCIEGLQEMRREAMKQQQELNIALNVMENRFAVHSCPECAKKSQKPEMADKSLETDESLSEIKYTDRKHENDINQLNTMPIDVSVPQLNIIQEKIAADQLEKTCPMCGCIYSSVISFDAFRQHVETHFLDDSLSDVDTSIERNFELVSHTVGDF